ncbi:MULTISPECIES: hypothetical protein [unclassified Enterococcus]|uniref:hypothetical protein n=1 Tax=unclassified Enterococcus TaxID=2608891 RepID=UPI0028FD5C85|nr:MULTISPECIES: hypothetical protein [unclassified Enterococcus]MDU0320694.1 hypothetical protein [Enterococcus sp. 2STP]MDU0335338.1 hypothetical protein [Enterococcus sp. 2CBP]MDU0350403.1 hypothetical protein [Enterococcus sp. 3MOLP]
MESETTQSQDQGEATNDTPAPALPTAELPAPQGKAGNTKVDPPLTLPPGYAAGTINDSITRQDNGDKLDLVWFSSGSVTKRGLPMLLNNGRSYVNLDALGVTPLVDKNITLGGSYNSGIFYSIPVSNRLYGHTQDSLYCSFYFNDNQNNHFKLEVVQTFNSNNSVTVNYTLQNLTTTTLKLGLLQNMDLKVITDFVPVSPVNNFEGFSLQGSSGPRLTILPVGFENWTAGRYLDSTKFRNFTPADADGVG